MINEFLKSRGYSNLLELKNKEIILSSIIRGCQYCRHSVKPIAPDIRQAPVLFIGRSPSLDDYKSDSLVNPNSIQGKIFDEYLSTLELVRQQVCVSNMCHCYLTNPNFNDVAICRRIYERYIRAIVNPKVIIYLGKSSVEQIYSPSINIQLSYNEWVITHMGSIQSHTALKQSTISYLLTIKDKIKELINASN